MRYLWQHIKTITDTYNGSLPLAHFLKNYFRQHPILGSRDRKVLSAMAYSFYRCNKGLSFNSNGKEAGIGIEEQISVCMKMCGNEHLLPPNTAKVNYPEPPFNLNALFPYDMPLSEGIIKEDWLRSMLIQPNLFIRIRKDNGKVLSLLNVQQIPYAFITDNCLSLPNGAKIDALLPADTYVVQDASSQQTGSYFTPKKNEQWYDCCAGAGGKSLLLKDLEPGVRLTITDLRETIIYNLQQRFRQYRHILPTAHVTDVSNKEQLAKALGNKLFDNIICDVPCSGSGTWARTPEQLYFFNPKNIDQSSTHEEAPLGVWGFPALQKKIAINVSGHLKPGGRLIYITCSVFRNENEDVVDEIIKQTGLQLLHAQIINGISMHADSMFVAVLKKE